MDESPDMIEGELGAQAERDPDDARLQQRLTELIEEQDDNEANAC